MYGSRERSKEEQQLLILCRVDWRLNPEHRPRELKTTTRRLQCPLPSYSSEFQTLEPLPHI